jgi:mRNA interferase MazF
MLRGEIRIVDLGQGLSVEATERRPAVIVSNDGANAVAARLDRGALTVVPVTSNVDRVYPFQVLLSAGPNGLERDSKAQVEQIRTISVRRIGDRIGQLTAAKMLEIDDALRLHLEL